MLMVAPFLMPKTGNNPNVQQQNNGLSIQTSTIQW